MLDQSPSDKTTLRYAYGNNKRSGAVVSVLGPKPKGPWIETTLRYAPGDNKRSGAEVSVLGSWAHR